MEKSAGIVIFDGARYLLLRYDAGHWDLPKGHVEIGESEHEAALRELQEETGLSAVMVPGFEERIHYVFTKGGKPVKKEVVFFVGKPIGADVVLSDEHNDFAWLAFDDAVKKLTFETAREVLRKADAFLKKNERDEESSAKAERRPSQDRVARHR